MALWAVAEAEMVTAAFMERIAMRKGDFDDHGQSQRQFGSQPPAAFSRKWCRQEHPLLAGRILAGNAEERQRPISVVQKYADGMRNDLWQTTQRIALEEKDGSLCDGQHRLTAVIQSGCSVWMPRSALHGRRATSSFDIGRKRTAGDALSSPAPRPGGNGKTAAAVASALKRGADMTTHSPSSAVIVAVYETHRPSGSTM